MKKNGYIGRMGTRDVMSETGTRDPGEMKMKKDVKRGVLEICMRKKTRDGNGRTGRQETGDGQMTVTIREAT